MMRRILYTYIFILIATASVSAQSRKVQNRPYTDLRPFHFGVLVGTHLQDIELENVGPQTITLEDGTKITAQVISHNRIEKVHVVLPKPEAGTE